MKFRTLEPHEIEVRVQSVTEKGAILLPYKDARCDMNLLDETGAIWKREHQLIDNKLFCTVSIWDKDIEQWVSRQDVGTESNTEKEKGQASDSFKRACFNWGIGRELYSSPFIWVNAEKLESHYQKDGKWKSYDKFEVAKISYNDNREIDGLAIMNSKTKAVIYVYNNTGKKN